MKNKAGRIALGIDYLRHLPVSPRFIFLALLVAGFVLVPIASAAAAPPVVTGLTPDHGPVAGGNAVLVEGENFEGSPIEVDFGANAATILNEIGPTELEVEAPAGATDGEVVDVTVTTPEGTSAISSADEYTYAIEAHIEITGTGEGEVLGIAPVPGNPPVNCHGAAPGEGTCDTPMQENVSLGGYAVSVEATATGASTFESFNVVAGEIVSCTGNVCVVKSEAGADVEIQAGFEGPAVPEAHIEITGTGEGEVLGIAPVPGNPPVNCHGAAPGEGTCDTPMQENVSLGGYAVSVEATATGASTFESFNVVAGEIVSCTGNVCVVKSEAGADVEIQAGFEGPAVPEAHIEITGTGEGEVLGIAPVPGNPPVNCHGAAPGEGTCDTPMQENVSLGGYAVSVEATATGASTFESFNVVAGEIVSCTGNVCVVKSEAGADVEIQAGFEGPAVPEAHIEITGTGEGEVLGIAPVPGNPPVNCHGAAPGEGTCDTPMQENVSLGGYAVSVEATATGASTFESFNVVAGEIVSCTGNVCVVKSEAGADVEIQAGFEGPAVPEAHIEITGTGEGEVLGIAPVPGNPPVNCHGAAPGEGTCDTPMQENVSLGGYAVSVEATATGASTFESFNVVAGEIVSCTGNVCVVKSEAGADVEIQAGFEGPAVPEAHIEITGTGEGEVLGIAPVPGNPPVNCHGAAPGEGTCDTPMQENVSLGGYAVSVEATATGASTFESFNVVAGEIVSCTGNVCVVKSEAGADVEIQAGFEGPAVPEAHIEITGTGEGEVLGIAPVPGNPPVNCHGAAPGEGTCDTPMQENVSLGGYAVSVEATATGASTFESFNVVAGEIVSCTGNVCVVKSEAGADVEIQAGFEGPAVPEAHIEITGTGEGEVLGIAPVPGNPPVNCHGAAPGEGTCDTPMQENVSLGGYAVSVEATATGASTFESFNVVAGEIVSCTGNVCVVKSEAGADVEIQAGFEGPAVPEAHIEITGTGEGEVLGIAPVPGNPPVNCHGAAPGEGTCDTPMQENVSLGGYAVSVEATATGASTFESFNVVAGEIVSCTGNVCVVKSEAGADVEIQAGFEGPAVPEAHIEITGTGEGEVLGIAPVPGNPPVNCHGAAPGEGTCDTPMQENVSLGGYAVSVEATATGASTFESFNVVAGEIVSCTGNVCVVKSEAGADVEIQAGFEGPAVPEAHIEITGTGEGEVLGIAPVPGNPPVNCHGAAPGEGTCDTPMQENVSLGGYAVSVEATATGASTFESFNVVAGEIVSCTGNVCVVKSEAGADVEIQAGFEGPAVPEAHIEITGTGEGEVLGIAPVPGNPPVNCHGAAPGEGTCDTPMQENVSLGGYAVSVEATATGASTFESFNVVAGEIVSCTGNVCVVKSEAGADVEIQAGFEGPAVPEAHIEITGTGEGEVLGIAPVPGNPPVNCHGAAPGEGTCDTPMQENVSLGGYAVSVEATATGASTFESFNVVAGEIVSCTGNVCVVKSEAGADVEIQAGFEGPAVPEAHIEITGTGEGEVLGIAPVPGNPPVNCHGAAPGEGTCDTPMQENVSLGGYAVSVEATATGASTFESFNVVAGEIVSCTGNVCVVKSEAGADVEIQAGFEGPAVPEAHIEITGTGEGEVLGIAPVPGNPPVNCHGAAPGEGTCDTPMQENVSLGGYAVSVEATATGASTFESFNVVAGEIVSCTGNVCVVKSEAGADVEIQAGFEGPAVPEAHIEITGTGEGEVLGIAPVPGNPPVNCHGAAPGEGTCDTPMQENVSLGGYAVSVEATATGASTFESFNVVAGEIVSCTGNVCVVKSEAGADVEIQAGFEGPAVPAPTVSSVSPNHGPPNTAVTITGEHFTGATAVKFGATNAGGTITVNGAGTQITGVTSPASCTSGTVDVTVTTPGGTSTTSASDHFTCEAAPPPAPSVSSVSPNHGPPNTAVTITGEHFTGATAVKFGATNAGGTITVNGAGTQITGVTSPASCTSGTVDVTVTTPGGTSTTSASDHFTCEAAPPPAPSVSSVSPTSGPTAGGNTVEVSGLNLTGATEVKFGSVSATPESSNFVKVTVKAPPHLAGTVDVRVVTAGGESPVNSPADHYTFLAPEVTAVVPSEGPAAGGTEVAITGSRFGGATEVKFGSTPAAAMTVESATEIKATTPAHAAGPVAVIVCDAGDCSPSGVTAANEFTFVAPPTVTGVSPDSGPAIEGGTEVTIAGSGFTGAEEVKFGAAEVACEGAGEELGKDCQVLSDSEIKATTPPHEAGIVDVHVVIPVGGESAANPPDDQFTYEVLDHPLSVSTSGTGAGTVECGTGGGPHPCAAEYPEATVVKLTASPAAGSEFIGWTGAGCSGSGACEVTMSAARSVDARFDLAAVPPKPEYSLTVNKTGPGSGSVSCNGGTCASKYPEGTIVTLSANADSGSSFYGWTGAGCSGSGNCVVTMNGDVTVTAAFESAGSGGGGGGEEPGKAIAPGKIVVKGNSAIVKLACRGGGACSGVLKLFAKLPAGHGKSKRQHKKSKLVLIGKRRFSVGAGASKSIKVTITNGKAKQQLRKKGKLQAKVKGTGVQARSVQLRLPTNRKTHKHHHKRGHG